jgi:S1-C subfamily serine protease
MVVEDFPCRGIASDLYYYLGGFPARRRNVGDQRAPRVISHHSLRLRKMAENATQLSCPHCFSILRPQKVPPLGTRVRCPSCKESFVIDENSLIETSPSSSEAPRAIQPSPELQPPTAVTKTPATASGPSAPGMEPAPRRNVVITWGIGGASVATTVVLIVWILISAVSQPDPRVANADNQETTTTSVTQERIVAPSASSNAATPTSPSAVVSQETQETKSQISATTNAREATAVSNAAPQASSESESQSEDDISVDRIPSRNDAVASDTTAKPASSLDRPPNTDVVTVSSGSTKAAEDPMANAEPKVDAVTSPIKSSPAIAFTLDPTKQYEYGYELVSGANDQGPIRATGTVTYRLQPKSSQRNSVMDEAFNIKKQLTGEAFVVHPDGWMVSCASLVRDATKIEALVERQRYTCEVVQIDDDNNLALLKFEGKNQLTLRCAASPAKQGSEVRVVSFSATTRPSTIRIVEGRVVGHIEVNQKRQIEIDAALIPTNIGGPLLTENGEVLGIITGNVVGGLGDADCAIVDLLPARALLERAGITWAVKSTDQETVVRDIAARVSAAVAKLSVDIEMGKSKEQLHLTFNGMSSGERLASHEFIRGTVAISPRGDVLTNESDRGDLSLLNTTVGTLAFDQLPRPNVPRWKTNRSRKVSCVGGPSSYMFGRSHFPMPRTWVGGLHGSPHGLRGGLSSGLTDDRSPEVIPHYRLPGGVSDLFHLADLSEVNIDDKVTYSVEKMDADSIVVNSDFVSTWKVPSSVATDAELHGTGQYTFDRSQGVITTGCSQYTLTVRSRIQTTTFPIRQAFKLNRAVTTNEAQQKEMEERKALQAADLARRGSRAILVLQTKSIPEAQVITALNDLALDSTQLNDAQQNEVATLLIPYLGSEQSLVCSAALQVAKRWATEVNIPVLMELLRGKDDTNSRDGVIQALGKTGGNERVAVALAKLLEEDKLRFRAGQGLRRMPRFAELAVLPYLKSNDATVRRDACRILGDVGGKKSMTALEALPKNTNGEYDIFVKLALDQIGSRLKVNGE